MQKQMLRLRKRSASRFLFPSAATALALLFLLVIFPLVPEIKLASATIDNTVYGLELTTNPSINLSIQPTAAGTISVAKDTVTANTNSPSGYKLYLSVNKDLDNNIYLEGDTSNDSTTTKFVPTTGTYESPSALVQNSWGYAVAGLNSFDTTYANPTTTSKFANLPTTNNEQLIHDHTGVATDDTTDIYYGVKADINIASGNYYTELLYTTISDVSSEVNGEATITPSQVNNGYTATELTITTSLVTNKNLGTISAMIGSAACEGIELVTNNPVTITCTLPAGLVGGKYNVVLNIPNLGKSYTIENGFEVSPQVTINVAEGSAGYGTISNNGFIAPYGTPITTNGNTIIIGDQTITATPAAQTAQYTYAFSSWTNNCGATITGNCTIAANFSRTARSYTVTFVTSPSSYGTVSRSSQTVTYGGAVSTSGATVTVAGTATTATPAAQTAQYTYAFASWTNNCGATVTGNCTITANFSRATRSYTVTFAVNASGYGTVSRSSQTVTYGGAVSVSGATATVAGTATTATPAAQTAQYTYAFSSWTNKCGTIVAGNCTITANFSRLQYMQNIASLKSSLALEQQVQMVDQRDGKVYWVAKLADGNVWMTQNLDYDLSVTANQTLKPQTSNVSTTRTVIPSGTNGTSNSAIYYVSGGDYYMDGNTAKTGYSSLPADSEKRHYAVGGAYSWRAAVAGQVPTDLNVYYPDISPTTNESICPAGWRLPAAVRFTVSDWQNGQPIDMYSASFQGDRVQYSVANVFGIISAVSDGDLESMPSAYVLGSTNSFYPGAGIASSDGIDIQKGNSVMFWTMQSYKNNKAIFSQVSNNFNYIFATAYSVRLSVRCVSI